MTGVIKMKKLFIAAMAVSLLGITPMLSQATPKQDLKKIRALYFKKFPGVPLQEFANGIYALDKARRYDWQAAEEFPAYEDAIEIGKKAFNKKFKNGKTFASCFKNGGIGIKQNYPYFDSKSGKVKTLEMEINECATKNGAKKMKWGKGKLAAISAYMAYTSRGKKTNVVVPNDKRALKIYNKGKQIFYAKRGQLNFACADCHVTSPGMMIRGNMTSTGVGQTTHWPAWRKKWANKTFKKKGKSGPFDGLGTLQRRYTGCNKQVRAKKWKLQKQNGYVALEYFHTYMSNGLKLNGPAVRQ